MTARATLATAPDGQRVIFYCPGCEERHQVDGRWSFNGDLERPTFSPSVLVGGVQWERGDHFYKPQHPDVAAGNEIRCHSFVTNGQIQFLGDCTHALAGQTVDLPEWSA